MPRMISAPRGTKRSCRGWEQEAALRMLMNNLDPDVAEDPDNLVVYSSNAKAARRFQLLKSFKFLLLALPERSSRGRLWRISLL